MSRKVETVADKSILSRQKADIINGFPEFVRTSLYGKRYTCRIRSLDIKDAINYYNFIEEQGLAGIGSESKDGPGMLVHNFIISLGVLYTTCEEARDQIKRVLLDVRLIQMHSTIEQLSNLTGLYLVFCDVLSSPSKHVVQMYQEHTEWREGLKAVGVQIPEAFDLKPSEEVQNIPDKQNITEGDDGVYIGRKDVPDIAPQIAPKPTPRPKVKNVSQTPIETPDDPGVVPQTTQSSPKKPKFTATYRTHQNMDIADRDYTISQTDEEIRQTVGEDPNYIREILKESKPIDAAPDIDTTPSNIQEI